jgi:ABC-type multidrug transport system fused ATPase/permease subunit
VPTHRSRSEDSAGLPALWGGPRRRHLAVLVCIGLGQALLAGLGVRLVVRSLDRTTSTHRGLLLAILLAAAVVVGLLRMAERVVSEQLSQSYVHEIRVGLVRHNLGEDGVKSLGVAVARATNDLSSVKTWVAQGVAPLAVDIPLLMGAWCVLLLLEPVLGLALVGPMALLLIGLRALSPIAYHRSRSVRRARGRLATQIADTVLATTAIRSGGGAVRELHHIERLSASLVEAAVHRAKAAGALRGLGAAVAGCATASIIGAGLATGLAAPQLAAALTVAGFLAAPLNDLGRVAEFRQTYRAARRIIGPAVELPARTAAASVAGPATPSGGGDMVTAQGLSSSDGTVMSDLSARPGDRVLLDVGNGQQATDLLYQLAGLAVPRTGRVSVSGVDLRSAPHGTLRRLVGYGAQGMMLARTSIGRAVCYRSAGTSAAEADRLLALVGLAERVGRLPRGTGTMLAHGGEPLTIPERARLTLARALFATPALLVFDHLDADLGRDGSATMREIIRDYPGVVVLASDDPWAVVTPTWVWRSLPRQALEDADVASAELRPFSETTSFRVPGMSAGVTDRQSETVT